MSPPSRAAWIEIYVFMAAARFVVSPPSRAAWIEIDEPLREQGETRVAAFTGGVD